MPQAGEKQPTRREERVFRRSYLVVYAFAILADWLQGPYVSATRDCDSFGHPAGKLESRVVAAEMLEIGNLHLY